MRAGFQSVQRAHVLAGLALSLVWLHPVHGAGQAKSSSAAGPSKSPPAAGSTANVVAELTATIQLLGTARHDYQGHRSKAVHEITAAIHALQAEPQQAAPAPGGPKVRGTGKGTSQPPVTKPPTQSSGTKPPATKPPVQPPTTKPPTQTGTTKPANPPAASEGQGHPSAGKKTRETQGESDAELRQALSQLKAAQGHLGNKHPQAKSSLQAAIAELQTALKIR